MPTQKESHAKRASISLTPRFHRRGTPPCRNPKYTKRTQFAPRQLSHEPIMQNEPNSRTAGVSPAFPGPNMRNEPNLPVRARHAVPQICETNPIPARPTANRQQPKAAFTKRTQFQPGQQPIANSQKLLLRNEPNYHPACRKRLNHTIYNPSPPGRPITNY